MSEFQPEKPNGVLFDAAGNVVYRFGNFRTDEWHEIPEHVDGFHGVEYSDSTTPGKALGRPIEALPGDNKFPDPTPPDHANARARPKGVDNPDADAFRGTRS